MPAEQRVCSFCGNAIEPGTGTMFVKKDGSVYYFDQRRCKQSLLTFGRLPRKFKWTKHWPRGRAAPARAAVRTQPAAAEVAKAEAAGEGKGKTKEAAKVKPSAAR